MPVSIVVGGQFGSEGKGKVSLEWVRRATASHVAVVRVGGPNSGHTAYDQTGRKFALRQMPAGAIDRNVDVVFPSGSFIDLEVLQAEINLLDYPRHRIFISPFANIITAEHKRWEQDANLVAEIGSTGSGVGAAVLATVARGAKNLNLQRHDAQSSAPLETFVCDTTDLMRKWLQRGDRIIVEGTQGFGLSLYDGGFWPKATARCTTAGAALAECGLSPVDVDDVTVVIRSYPIRVAGESGPLPEETTWEAIADALDIERDLREFTTVTNKLRRVGNFDAGIVRSAIAANNPTRIVMNHMDYVRQPRLFVDAVEHAIGRRIDYLGFSPQSLEARGLLVD